MATVPKPARVTVAAIAVTGLLLGGILAPPVPADALAQQSQPETDNTVTHIEVYENGSARWTIRIRTRLDTDQRVEEYRTFQEGFRNDTAQYLGQFRTRMQGVVANAANATGREMRATNVTASTDIQEVPRRWGVVTYQFTWTDFATTEGDTLAVGDVFQGGWYIAENDTLQIEGPSGHVVSNVAPPPASQNRREVTWTGQEDFEDRHPRVAFSPAANSLSLPMPRVGTAISVVLGIVGLSIIGLVAITIYGRRDEKDGAEQPADTDTETEPETPSGEPTETNGDTADAPVLTDEERVLNLLEANEGRLRQAAIADEFDWTASKTSRVVGTLADDGSVEKLRIGRENLVSLSDHAE